MNESLKRITTQPGSHDKDTEICHLGNFIYFTTTCICLSFMKRTAKFHRWTKCQLIKKIQVSYLVHESVSQLAKVDKIKTIKITFI